MNNFFKATKLIQVKFLMKVRAKPVLQYNNLKKYINLTVNQTTQLSLKVNGFTKLKKSLPSPLFKKKNYFLRETTVLVTTGVCLPLSTYSESWYSKLWGADLKETSLLTPASNHDQLIFSRIVRWGFKFKRFCYSCDTIALVSWKQYLYQYLENYKLLGNRLTFNLYVKTFFKNDKNFNFFYYLYWTFTKTHRLYINMRNKTDVHYNYLSLYSGIFLKFYKNRKPLRGTKLFKMLIVKFLRKLLISAEVRDLVIILNKTPTQFLELFKTFLQPTIYPFLKPNKRKPYYDELDNSKTSYFSVHQFIFQKVSYSAQVRDRRRGRLKRKIIKRLIKKNSILD